MFKRLRRLLPSRPIRTLTSLEAYERWASTYPPNAHNTFMETEETAMRQLLPDLSGQVVLDLACGSGRYGLLAAQQGAKLVIGLDNSPAMLAANRQPRLALGTTDAIPLPDQSVDVILCGLALGHVPQLAPSIREMGRVLTGDGLALISDFHPLAAFAGGQRTFRAGNGKLYAVEHYPHLYADYHRAVHAAGLAIIEVIERGADTIETAAPIVIVYALRKPG